MVSFEQLTPRIQRLIVPAAGPYSRFASNAYLIGRGASRMLVDSGTGHPGSAEALKGLAIGTRVVLTHAHGGHANGLAHLQRGVKIAKFKSQGDAGEMSFLRHNEKIVLRDDATSQVDCSVKVIHCPGHSEDSVALWLEEESVLISGDAISSTPSPAKGASLSHDHITVENLDAYMASLKTLDNLNPRIIFPGHGEIILDGASHIAEALSVQNRIENSILQLLQSSHVVTANAITAHLAANSPGISLLVLEGTVKQHLIRLEARGLAARVHATRGDGKENVSQAERSKTGPGGITFDKIFDAVKTSRTKDWMEESKGVSKDAMKDVFRLREKVHPAHQWIRFSNEVEWRAV
ncbi:hypothetical protein CcCBS67573_g01545 [Chytriomyces confervae]|uniref:Metallo-beta-lactamase domain-containing protein n=1 Tax=Chytriomyces confervae TaxID=246404 RepID=A0A507FP18_9FUNG|nr:hypothetical protein CcCBS67573_g01545 [Chytriomyces confervae]